MSNIEEAVLRRFSGAKILAASVVLGLAGYLPLQLYIWFGPEHGNPIGLGLLAFPIGPPRFFLLSVLVLKRVDDSASCPILCRIFRW